MASLDPHRNLVAALSYLLFFVTGIVILMVEKEDKFVRFHAMQSTLATGGLFIFNLIVGFILKPLGILGFLANIFNIAVWLVILGICLVGFINAYNGRVLKLPIVGEIAERRVK